ncbi:hypothetical protein T12_16617 [Trichinella patagoniensis]|uniref:Uncharacterized protein n=1 Tax=Trichinella patagoniensis TaxID=990121 RepID=A0A0V1A9C2_9BILA|nr:hypothetical protein T12_16617 [Trichinella patagoniensis]
MKENRVAQNNEILNNRAQCDRIPHYNGETASHTKIQPPWVRIRGVPVVQLPCKMTKEFNNKLRFPRGTALVLLSLHANMSED